MVSSQSNRVLLAVSGSIAAYKVADLASLLKKQGFEVRVILTANASQFVSPLVLETLTGFPVRSTLFGPGISGTEHIEYARWADLIVFVPATANLIAKLDLGLADDLVTTVALATRAPWIIAPAMNSVMWENSVTQNHVQSLTARGVQWVAPENGVLACGEEGIGKLAAPENIVEIIVKVITQKPSPQRLKGQTLLITAGPTISRIDAVRYITNPSSGRMGAALAEEALTRGAQVFYILGVDKGVVRPTPPPGTANFLKIIEVETAEEMLREALIALPQANGVIAASAVLDYRVKNSLSKKMKRTQEPTAIDLIPSVDVLDSLRKHSKKGQWFFGFAAETESLQKNGPLKLKNKNLDYLFANQIAHAGKILKTGFGVPTNGGVFFRKRKKPLPFQTSTKSELARLLFDVLEEDFK